MLEKLNDAVWLQWKTTTKNPTYFVRIMEQPYEVADVWRQWMGQPNEACSCLKTTKGCEWSKDLPSNGSVAASRLYDWVYEETVN